MSKLVFNVARFMARPSALAAVPVSVSGAVPPARLLPSSAAGWGAALQEKEREKEQREIRTRDKQQDRR